MAWVQGTGDVFHGLAVAMALAGGCVVINPGVGRAEGDNEGVPTRARLWVAVQEKALGVFGTTGFEVPGATEAALADEFIRLGYPVVDAAAVRRNITQEEGLRALEGDARAAAAVGLRHGAAYSVVATALSKQAGAKLYGTQMQTVHATVAGRLIRNADAQVLASGSVTASEAHVDEIRGGALAMEKAARALARELDGKVIAGAEAAAVVTVHISGLKSYRHLDFIQRSLEGDLAGTGLLRLLSFTAGTAEWEMRGVEAAELAARLSRAEFEGFRLEPTQVAGGAIDLKVVLETP